MTYIYLTILLLLLLVCVPICEIIMPKTISYRWILVALIATLVTGACIDFTVINNTSREIILTGGLSIIGAYIILRSVEKLILARVIHKAQYTDKSGRSIIICGAEDNTPSKDTNNVRDNAETNRGSPQEPSKDARD